MRVSRPVLDMNEAPNHRAHARARRVRHHRWHRAAGCAERRACCTVRTRPPPRRAASMSLNEALAGWMSQSEIGALRNSGLTLQGAEFRALTALVPSCASPPTLAASR